MNMQNDQEEDKMALDISKITMQYCCALKQEENKNLKSCTFCCSVICPSMTMTSSPSEVTAHCVCSIYTINFHHL